MSETQMNEKDGALQALAAAWASIDGKLEKFNRGKKAKSISAYGGHYAGYIEDARELRKRLVSRGFVIVPPKLK